MTSNQIKAHFALTGLTITEVALSIGESRATVSQVIGYFRGNDRVRQKLKRRYGITFNTRTKLRESTRRAA